MLATIYLDYHAALETDEVYDETANRLLAPKFHARDLPALELMPETPFCVRQVVAKFSRALGIHPPILAVPTHPAASGWALGGSVTCTSNSRLAPRKGGRNWLQSNRCSIG
jgi:hypothetical protein